MSTSVIRESMPGPGGPMNANSGHIDVEFTNCDCCGLTEECTLSYIQTIRERRQQFGDDGQRMLEFIRYGGKWICGLCAEAVKDEVLRCRKLMISPDEAMARHLSFCNKFRASGPLQDPAVGLIRAMSRVLRRSLEGPKAMRSMPNSRMGRRVVGIMGGG